jgi:hypothetical protein
VSHQQHAQHVWWWDRKKTQVPQVSPFKVIDYSGSHLAHATWPTAWASGVGQVATRISQSPQSGPRMMSEAFRSLSLNTMPPRIYLLVIVDDDDII